MASPNGQIFLQHILAYIMCYKLNDVNIDKLLSHSIKPSLILVVLNLFPVLKTRNYGMSSNIM